MPPKRGIPPPVVPKAKPKAKAPPLGGPRLPLDGAEAGPKLRPLFWKSLEQVAPESVWANLDPPAPFDKALLEKQFALAESKSPPGQLTPRGMTSQDSRKRIRVLDDQTSHLLAIAFGRLPPPDRVAAMVDNLEDFPEGLPPEAVRALSGAVAEQREAVDQLQQHIKDGSLSSLDLPERYLAVVGSVRDCVVKLSCGALIVGSANELGDLRYSSEKVGTCCQAIRDSTLLRKCVSTCLAVGNHLNRGTARSRASGVVLPEALLKLDELKAAPDKEAAQGTPSALDFVAQALVEESGIPRMEQLRSEAEKLQVMCKDASTVCMEESERSCRRILAEAAKTVQSLDAPSVQEASGFRRIYNQVKKVHKEAEFAVQLLDLAKKEVVNLQQWSSVKGPMKSEDCFKGWSQFLERLVRAISRARPASGPGQPAASLQSSCAQAAKVNTEGNGMNSAMAASAVVTVAATSAAQEVGGA